MKNQNDKKINKLEQELDKLGSKLQDIIEIND